MTATSDPGRQQPGQSGPGAHRPGTESPPGACAGTGTPSEGRDREAGDAGAEESAAGGRVADAAQAVGQLAGEAAQLGMAWFDLARAEAALARTSAVRLLGGAAAVVVLALCLWLFSCAALAMWLTGWLGRADAALALVAGLHLILMGALVWAMRRWLRALQMRRSREALAQLGKAFSP